MRRTALFSVLAAGLELGCAEGARVAPLRGPGALLGGSRAYLLAATEDPSDEIGGLLDWEPGKPLEPVAPEPVARKRGPRNSRLGVRCAFVLPGETSWKTGVRAGAYYKTPVSGRAPIELGIEYVALRNEDETVSSEFFYARADVGLGPAPDPDRRVRFYPLAGVELVYELARLQVKGEELTPYAVGVNVGLGAGACSGRWDIQAFYTWLAGSTNMEGEALVAIAVGF